MKSKVNKGERLHNSDFNPLEFEGVRKQAGANAFTMSPKKWIEATDAISNVSKAGRYGGTYAHSDIAISFATWVKTTDTGFRKRLYSDKFEVYEAVKSQWSTRQKRITFDGRHFRIDLVFYNNILKCFILIDLKVGDLTHQDLG